MPFRLYIGWLLINQEPHTGSVHNIHKHSVKQVVQEYIYRYIVFTIPRTITNQQAFWSLVTLLDDLHTMENSMAQHIVICQVAQAGYQTSLTDAHSQNTYVGLCGCGQWNRGHAGLQVPVLFKTKRSSWFRYQSVDQEFIALTIWPKGVLIRFP